MPLTVCVLASGSAANCTYVASGQTRILIDAGLSAKETSRRLLALDADLSALDAICVTHEHEDHKASLGSLHRKHRIPLYANTDTIRAVERSGKQGQLQWQVFTTGVPFQVKDLRIEPFSVPHDAYDPVGFVVSGDGARLGVVTDMGMATTLVRERLRDCHALILESNHDADMLKDAARPWSLKQRIAGRQGHLSNAQAAELIAEVAGPRLSAVFIAHISAECNRPELAAKTIRAALEKSGCGHVAVHLTYADRVSEVVQIGEAAAGLTGSIEASV
jgi:phosphoribosyl 1,2-cyclic phosphodiesterase